MGLARVTVARAVLSETPPRYSRAPAGSKLDRFKDWICERLRDDPTVQAQRLREIPSSWAMRVARRSCGGSAGACRHAAGHPLLLITGIGAHLDTWTPFARLVGGRELIAFDPPGAGLSQRPQRPLRIHGLADVVRELLDALGLERVDVLGYSFA